eukprot:NODE_378_length_8478_cov_0.790070.p6 type:complete len:145 gc:universal NODE_378_length_8478_cov_0.790070:3440-3874(+)
MQATSSCIKTFKLKGFEVDDKLPVDLVVNKVGFHIADIHFKLPKSFEFTKIVIVSTKYIHVPTHISFLKVKSIEKFIATLVAPNKYKPLNLKATPPKWSDFFNLSKHAYYVTKELRLCDLNLVDVDLLVDEGKRFQKMFRYKKK